MKIKLTRKNSILIAIGSALLAMGGSTSARTTTGATTGPQPTPATGPSTGPGPGPRYLSVTNDDGGSNVPTAPTTSPGGLPPWLSGHPAANVQVLYTGPDPVIARSQLHTLTVQQIREFSDWKRRATGMQAGSNIVPTAPDEPPPAWWIPTYL